MEKGTKVTVTLENGREVEGEVVSTNKSGTLVNVSNGAAFRLDAETESGTEAGAFVTPEAETAPEAEVPADEPVPPAMKRGRKASDSFGQ